MSGQATRKFNEYFPVSHFQEQPWYGGHFRDTNDNSYQLFSGEGMKFLVVCLEFGPRDEVLTWAGTVIAEHPDYRVIVVTHCYMYGDNTRVGPGDDGSPEKMGGGPQDNDGEEIWAKLISRYRNIFLVLSGHEINPGVGRLTSTGDNGNPVHQLLANYQTMGGGYLRVMKFVPAENRIEVRTYSPLRDKYLDDAYNQFTLDYDMTGKL